MLLKRSSYYSEKFLEMILDDLLEGVRRGSGSIAGEDRWVIDLWW